MLEHAPGRSCGPWSGAHAGVGFLAGAVAHGEAMLEHPVPEGLYCMRRTHTGAEQKH